MGFSRELGFRDPIQYIRNNLSAALSFLKSFQTHLIPERPWKLPAWVMLTDCYFGVRSFAFLSDGGREPEPQTLHTTRSGRSPWSSSAALNTSALL